MKIILSPRAIDDLGEIEAFIAEDNPVRALSYLREMRAKIASLGEFPQASPLRPEYGPNVRVVLHGVHMIFYRVFDADIRIERVLHTARDVRTL